MDRRTFTSSVAKAVNHLYDLGYLQRHPLAALLVADPAARSRGRELQRILVDAIQALKPPAGLISSSPAWRTHRYLYLRCVQVEPPAQIAREFGLGERQARRIYHDALEALASVLWDRHSTGAAIEPAAIGPARGAVAGAASETVLDQEVHHLAAAGRGAPTALAEVLDSLRPILATLARQHGCAWSVDVDPGPPRAAADRVVVRQVLLSLCALGFDRGPGTVRLAVRARAGWVELDLSCRPAESSDRTSAPAGDRGDRLPIIRRLVESEGGTIAAGPRPDGGFAAVARLPAESRPLVLVVDDNPDVVAMFRRYLEGAGCEVITANAGAEGLHVARQVRPAAITLDVMMASTDGWETLQLLKNHPETHGIPVVMCSVLREQELARVLGAAELLPKPVTGSELLAALERCGLRLAAGAR